MIRIRLQDFANSEPPPFPGVINYKFLKTINSDPDLQNRQVSGNYLGTVNRHQVILHTVGNKILIIFNLVSRIGNQMIRIRKCCLNVKPQILVLQNVIWLSFPFQKRESQVGRKHWKRKQFTKRKEWEAVVAPSSLLLLLHFTPNFFNFNFHHKISSWFRLLYL